MASRGNRHCASCIGTLSFPNASASRVRQHAANRLKLSAATHWAYIHRSTLAFSWTKLHAVCCVCPPAQLISGSNRWSERICRRRSIYALPVLSWRHVRAKGSLIDSNRPKRRILKWLDQQGQHGFWPRGVYSNWLTRDSTGLRVEFVSLIFTVIDFYHHRMLSTSILTILWPSRFVQSTITNRTIPWHTRHPLLLRPKIFVGTDGAEPLVTKYPAHGRCFAVLDNFCAVRSTELSKFVTYWYSHKLCSMRRRNELWVVGTLLRQDGVCYCTAKEEILKFFSTSRYIRACWYVLKVLCTVTSSVWYPICGHTVLNSSRRRWISTGSGCLVQFSLARNYGRRL